MWAIRSARNFVRYHRSTFLAPLASFAKVNKPNNSFHSIVDYQRCILMDTKGFLPQLSSSFQLFLRNISNQYQSSTFTPHSSDKDVKVNGFFEFEDIIGEMEEDLDNDIEEMAFVSELSHDDTSEYLYKIDSNAGERMKRISSMTLFRIISDTPSLSMSNKLDELIEEGCTFEWLVIEETMIKLRNRKMFRKALQLSEWLEAKYNFTFREKDYIWRLDLIAKVHGVTKAENYIEKISESLRGELIYRTLLANCTSANLVTKSEEIFEKIKALGPSSHSCNQMIFLYMKVDSSKIIDILKFMEEENIKLNLVTYRLLIATKGRIGDITGMEKVLEKMETEKIDPDFLIQSMVAKYYLSNGLRQKAKLVLKKIEEYMNENHKARRVLLHLYACLGKSKDVARIWDLCKKTSGPYEFLAAIEAWDKLGKTEEAKKVFDEMPPKWKEFLLGY